MWSTPNVQNVWTALCRTFELHHNIINVRRTFELPMINWTHGTRSHQKLDGSFGYKYYGLVPRLNTQSPSVLHHLQRVIRVWKCQTLQRDRNNTVRNINGWRYCFLGIKAFRFCFLVFIPHNKIVILLTSSPYLSYQCFLQHSKQTNICPIKDSRSRCQPEIYTIVCIWIVHFCFY